jgi:hypothetical protein
MQRTCIGPSIYATECERGFSQMNVIVSATRDPSMAKTVSVLLFVKVVGRPFPRFDPAYYVETWLLREGR